MENMMIRNQTRMSSPSSSSLSLHKDSQTISKAKPKIRIIHIFAPEIIKTDVANFRELVQRLTGKPALEKGCKKKARIGRRDIHIHHQDQPRSTSGGGFCEKPPPVVAAAAAAAMAKKMELRSTGFFAGLETRERAVKEEEGTWNNNNGDHNSGGFLTGFGDLDGFIQELGEFPLLPLDASHHMHGFEEAQLA
ncbi:VQ motif-containing protein [Corchorus capsularis]|uniref:VQ motif-containing protein n=1 Tax=Corchorus capsularis TaxID=210143 RepID=A0A1R3GY99_COCAP|nr:VQ motif-containing protein [Corchorus capsularis]